MKIHLEWGIEGYKVLCEAPGVGTTEPPVSKSASTIGDHLEEFTRFVFSSFVNDLRHWLAKARAAHPELKRALKSSEKDLKVCESINAQTTAQLSPTEIKQAMEGKGGFIEGILASRGVPARAIQVIGLLCDLLCQSAATRGKL
jgi:hypothetical protein